MSRFHNPGVHWTSICSESPAEYIRQNDVDTIRLSSTRWAMLRLAVAYQSNFDGIFYAGPHWGDELGLRVRRLSRRSIPVIPTFEGIIADEDEVRHLSDLVGHPVFSEPFADGAIPRLRYIYGEAKHIIAISPFLVRVAKFLYGDKVSCLPLGVEGHIFHSAGRREPARCRVVCCGTVKQRKNPQIFLRLAGLYKEAEFVWFGDGVMRQPLIAEAKKMALENLRFPGPILPGPLAEEFRNSSIFVIPSYAEGVPKVTNEAAACGLPIILNGFYEATTVVHKHNGLVAWSDEELIEHVGTLIRDPDKRTTMGQRGAEMAKQWDWDLIAPQWEDLIIRQVTQDI
ncbi:MAG TPA: glycosyltransferase family 4 protein [Candidatus Sulfotelmatobacter sp.]|nr:glycosyltransferase family 4 protein [Candidatus Sulfotelmatobacter sp.]